MTEVKTKAVELINRLPDDKMAYILGILQVFERNSSEEMPHSREDRAEKTNEPTGYKRLLKYRGTLKRHVDVKKELAEARDEKYARIL
jgi:hypothetical protein